MVWFSPDGSRVVRSERWGGYLMSWLYELHMRLLAGEAGRQIVGWSGFAIVVLLVSGLLLWWPRGSWRKALAFKRNAVQVRRLRDIHKLSGLGSSLLLVLLVVTGALLALPDVKDQLFAATIAARDTVPAPRSSATGGQQISVIEALAAARRALPEGRLAFIDVPGAGDGPLRMRSRFPATPIAAFPAASFLSTSIQAACSRLTR